MQNQSDKKKKKLEKEMTAARKKIDSADRALLKAFSTRFKAVKRIGDIKKKLEMPALQKNRWSEVVEDRVKRAKKAGVNEGFIRQVLELIHIEAIRIQEK